MSLASVLQRVAIIDRAMSDPASLVGSATALAGSAAAPIGTSSSTSGSSFAAALQDAGARYQAQGASAPYGLSALMGSGGEAGRRIVALAESQVGQAEQPPGSNESPAIAQYRGASAGAIPGAPWCAYFASWVTRQAGEPLGEQGQGLGSVSEIWSWAQSAGRAVPNGTGVVPKPGDLIVFGGEHVGIVKEVLPDGRIQTIEGNYENRVTLNVRAPSEASGYVSMSQPTT